MGSKETNISNQICIELCKRGCVIQRDQVGLFYTRTGSPIHIGVKGHSDLSGHRGTDGKAFYIEAKTPIGVASKEQINFINKMRESNALAGFAHSVNEALEVVFPNEYKRD